MTLQCSRMQRFVRSYVRVLSWPGLLRVWVFTKVEELDKVLPVTLEIHHKEMKLRRVVLVGKCDVIQNPPFFQQQKNPINAGHAKRIKQP